MNESQSEVERGLREEIAHLRLDLHRMETVKDIIAHENSQLRSVITAMEVLNRAQDRALHRLRRKPKP